MNHESYVLVQGQPTALAVSATNPHLAKRTLELTRKLAPVNPEMAQGILVALVLLSAAGLEVMYATEHGN